MDIKKLETAEWQDVDGVMRTDEFRALVQCEAELAAWTQREHEARTNAAAVRRGLRVARRNVEVMTRRCELQSDVLGGILADSGWVSRARKLAGAGLFAGAVAGVVLFSSLSPVPGDVPGALPLARPVEAAAPAGTGGPVGGVAVPDDVTADAEAYLAAFLASKNPELASCASRLVAHDTWTEAVAIAGHETGYCSKGVARFNNCGGIRSSRPDRDWRQYSSKCDGLEDVAILLEKPLYAGRSVAELNGTYCVHEGGGCPGWTEDVAMKVAEITAGLDAYRR